MDTVCSIYHTSGVYRAQQGVPACSLCQRCGGGILPEHYLAIYLLLGVEYHTKEMEF